MTVREFTYERGASGEEELYKTIIKSQLTEFVTSRFIGSDDSYYHMMSVAVKYLSHLRAVPVFKGGNILRFYEMGAAKRLSKDAGKLMTQYFGEAFRVSDIDCSMYASSDSEATASTPAYMGALMLMRDHLEKDPTKFDFFSKDRKSDPREELQGLISGINDKLRGGGIHNVTVTGVRCGGSALNAGRRIDSYGMADRTITINKETNEVSVQLQDEQHWIYASANTSIEFEPGTVAFYLLRLKVAFTLALRIDGENVVVNSGGELFDLSVALNESRSEVMEHFSEKVTKITFVNAGKRVAFNAYSMHYLWHDLDRMLFREGQKPWEIEKYEKRIKRIILFSFLWDMTNTQWSLAAVDELIGVYDRLIESLESLEWQKQWGDMGEKMEELVHEIMTIGPLPSSFRELVTANLNYCVDILETMAGRKSILDPKELEELDMNEFME